MIFLKIRISLIQKYPSLYFRNATILKSVKISKIPTANKLFNFNPLKNLAPLWAKAF